jgi:hypothetical protein
MTNREIIAHILKLKLQVCPKLDDSNNVIGWTVGKTMRHGHDVYVPNMDIARGDTIEEAISNLLAGKTIWNEEILPMHRHMVNMHNDNT